MPTEPNKPSLLSVAEALTRVLDGLPRTKIEQLPLEKAHGRILAEPLASRLTLPEHAVSAMDGYAVNAKDCYAVADGGLATLTRIGESAAGHPWFGRLGNGETVRIFTGAMVPNGADSIVLQEDVIATAEEDGARITLTEKPIIGRFIRQAGLDVTAGEEIQAAGAPLSARALALALSTGHTLGAFHSRPQIGILSTGDELVRPGENAGPGQIISSNAAYLTAVVTTFGGDAVQLGIARDRSGAMLECVRNADRQLDLIVTTGGASVGVHDHIVSDLSASDTMDDMATTNTLNFWKIAMRPGKPLIFGRVDGIPLLGLPGNPVSSAVCALVFLRPAIMQMAGGVPEDNLFLARLTTPLDANDQRQDYLRARLSKNDNDLPLITPFDRQDSSMISVFKLSNTLLVRPPFDVARSIGDLVTAMPIPSLL